MKVEPQKWPKWREMTTTQMLPCPRCGSTRGGIVDSRRAKFGVRRRRGCADCGNRWSTAEVSVALLDELESLRRLRDVIAEVAKP